MNNNELLFEIDNAITYANALSEPGLRALRAVVEILNGYNDGQVRVNEEFNQGILSLSNVIKDAIEKELS